MSVKVVREAGLTFGELREKNVARCEEVFHGLNDWNPSEWSNALAGETGETCNLTKKLKRGERVPALKIGEEIADVVIYADLLAARLGVDLEMLIIRKFNKVSRKRRSTIYLDKRQE